MPNTYVALRTETVAVATNTITFDLSTISGYTDLVLVTSIQRTATGNTRIRFNGDTGTNYSTTYIEGNGSAASSSRNSNQTFLTLDYSNSTSNFVPSIAHIMNYANTTTNKTVINRTGDAGVVVLAYAQLWRNTAAINSITCLSDTTFAVGSTFSLYGIANADQGAAKATGGIITEDSQYWYHTFGASGAFIPKQSLTCDVLVVAGGGGGGRTVGGGGGAGGLLGFASQSLSATSYNVTVGAGGPGSTVITSAGTNGVDSQFASLTLVKGGGGGGSYTTKTGATGGSGGGGGGQSGTAGSPTSGQGNSGGVSSTVQDNAGGGGGGAGAVGATGVSGVSAGNGGVGSSAYSSWGIAAGVGHNVSGTVYFAGGGGGGSNYNSFFTVFGTGGFGGGAAGKQLAADGVPTAATANTGGGGGGSGGSGDSSNGGNGGSGIVIIRYSK